MCNFFLVIIPFFFNNDLYTAYHTVYAHGIIDTTSQIKRFKSAIPTDQEHTTTIVFPDSEKETGYGLNRLISEISTVLRKPVNRSKMYMGTSNDLLAMHHTISKIASDQRIILYGCSRGGATCLSYLAQYNPKNITALILDATPSCMPETIHPFLATIGINSSYDQTIFSTLFPAYQKNSLSPLEAIKQIKNKNIAILLLHSQNDTKVPFIHSMQLYLELKNNGFEHVYLVPFEKGAHAFLLQCPESKQLYLQAVHSFYKKYNLVYDPQLASESLLEKYQPTIENTIEKIKEYQQSIQDKYLKSVQRNTTLAGCAFTLIFLYFLLSKLQKA
ncbi:alpha/beta fold hydrolase [Candidatus Dependentiae bacterium]|nr:alpha/beta fold hydrolase [Candidatus Dependentiae bacterium]